MSEWIQVAQASDLQHGANLVIATGRRIALFSMDDGFYAIDDTCSHAEYSLSEGDVENGQVECPGHGAKFDIRSGRNLTFPAVTPVRSYPVKLEGGNVYIQIPH